MTHSTSSISPRALGLGLVAFFLALPLFSSAQNDRSADARLEYVRKYKGLAISEMERAGIPASITLAQAILESNAGQSTLAIEANNHFGIKCGGDWKGKDFYAEDDDRDRSGNLVKSCFRKYKKVEQSYEDHSDFLRDPKKFNRYGFLFRLNQQDYRSWAYGLQSAGYATSDTYAESLIRIIESYKLFEFDKGAASGGGNSGGAAGPIAAGRGIDKVNDTKVLYAKEGQTIEEIARIYRLSAEKIVEFNDRGYARSDKLAQGTKIYIQKKQKRWRGRSKFHFVQDNQTMFGISQQYGVQLEKLLVGNKMSSDEEPANSEQVRLRGFFWKKGPKPRLREVPDSLKNNPAGRPSSAPQKDNSKLTTDNDELFEIGKGEVKTDKNKPATPPATDRPATTNGEYSDPKNTEGKTYLPPPAVRPGKPQPTQPAPPADALFHTVQKGDTLYNISKKYGTTVQRIRELNNMADDNIQIGQSLRVQ